MIIGAVIAAFAMFITTPSAPVAHADINGYPCSYPGTGIGAEVIIANGQFCDGPTEINLTHIHCESGGANIGAFGLAGQNGISLGAIGSSGIGGAGCSWRCPDNTLAPAPNPPSMWHNYLDVNRIIKAHKAFCVVENHLAPAGPTSELVRPEEGDPDLAKNNSEMLAPGTIPEHHGEGVAPTPNGILPIPAVPGFPSIP